MTEAGFWTMTDEDAAGLRACLEKGGNEAYELGVNCVLYGLAH